MDLDTRIERRRQRDAQPRLVRDYAALSPVAHDDEPTDRGPTLERLLDHLDPTFDGTLPPNAYVHGPQGVGKSAVVAALFDRLRVASAESRTAIHTSTRAAPPTLPRYTRVDMRTVPSAFAFYREVLDAVVDEPVPEHGVSTDELRERLRTELGDAIGVVVAVDHVDAGEFDDDLTVRDLFAGLPSNASWVAIGRADPDEVAVTRYTGATIAMEPYRGEVLVDLLMARASRGLARAGLDHELARRVADWAGGNAHDALAALFVAADRADRDGRTRIDAADVDAAIEATPEPSVSLGRVLSVGANRQLVLRKLVDLEAADRGTVTATTAAIADDPDVDLSPGTVKRYLYELAEAGIVERVRADEADHGRGRPPSRVELRFHPDAFARLYDLQA